MIMDLIAFITVCLFRHGSHQSSVERYRDIVCMYYQGIPNKDDILSDDQVSHV